MRFLADENVEPVVVAWLRDGGHDVLDMREVGPGTGDDSVLQTARDGGRVLVTYDLDFGELVYRRRLIHAGVVLLRLRQAKPADRLRALQRHWAAIVVKLPNSFIVVHDRKVRVRRMMPPSGGSGGGLP